MRQDPALTYTVVVDRELAELLPAFMENRRKEVATLRALLAADDLESLRVLGDRIKSAGGSYGLERLAVIGRLIEANARQGNRLALRTLVDQYERHLAGLRISFK